jgi:hypothetical protein
VKDPRAHFREPVDGDPVGDGVCGLLIAEKLGVSQPIITEYMRLLVDIGAVRPKRIKQWNFYKRDEERIKTWIANEVSTTLRRRSKLPAAVFADSPTGLRKLDLADHCCRASWERFSGNAAQCVEPR